MTRICFITNEVFPIKPGGIGRLMYNFSVQNQRRGMPVSIHLLMLWHPETERSSIRASLEGLAEVHFCPKSVVGFDNAAWPHGGYDGFVGHLNESLIYYEGLCAAQREIKQDFDIIEFPDFGGWGAVSIAAKRGAIAFKKTLLTVRLHSTYGTIIAAEPFYHKPSSWSSGRTDLERFSLSEADLIVGHLGCIVDYNENFYKFDKSWRDKVIVEFPPILLDGLKVVDYSNSHSPCDFIFSSRLQPFKRPDLFVRAAVKILREAPEIGSCFRLISYGWDTSYISWLKSLIPPSMDNKIIFVENASKEDRAEFLARSIAVIPSNFESLCLFAYECSLSGRKTILNGACKAFGDQTPWKDNENCLTFDGSFQDLARIMYKAIDWTPRCKVNATPDVPYWENPPTVPTPTASSMPLTFGEIWIGSSSVQQVNTVLIDRNCDNIPTTVHATVPRPAFPGTPLQSKANVLLHPVEWIMPTPSEIMEILENISADLVTINPIGLEVEQEFFEQAFTAIQQDSSLVGVTCYTRVCASDGSAEGVRFYPGGLATLAFSAPSLCAYGSVFRRDAVLRIGLRDEAGDRWFDDFTARLVQEGLRVIAIPMVGSVEPANGLDTLIDAEAYHAQLRNEFGISLGLKAQMGSIANLLPDKRKHVSSFPGELHPIEEFDERARIGSAEITRVQGIIGEDSYAEIAIKLKNVRIGVPKWDEINLKLGHFRNIPKIEIRNLPNGFFENWPPQDHDEWGCFWAYRAIEVSKIPAVGSISLHQLSPRDRDVLYAIVKCLPDAIFSADSPHSFQATDAWCIAAKQILKSYEADMKIFENLS